jgi:hypothetical protein
MQYIPPTLPIANISVANTTHDLVDRVQTVVDYLNGNPIGTSGNTETSNNALHLGGKLEGDLNVNSAITANSANTALTANNSTYAFGLSQNQLNVNSANTANDAAYLGGHAANTYLYPVSNTTPANGQTLYWSAANSNWYPADPSGNVTALDANNANYLNTHSEAQLNVNSAVTANSANTANLANYIIANTGIISNAYGVFVNAAYINTIAANSATNALTANNSTYAFGLSQNQLNVNSAISANTANNSTYAFGKSEAGLNVNSAVTANSANSALTANDSTYAFGKSESALSVNVALTANNSTYAFGKSEAGLNVNSASSAVTANTANNSTYAFGKSEAGLNVNSAVTANSANTANNSTYAFGKSEGALNVNSAVSANTSNNSSYLGGYASSAFVRPFTGSPSDGQVLTWNGSGSTWFPGAGGSGAPHAILSNTHTDANVATAQNGDLIMAEGGSSNLTTYSTTYTWLWTSGVESWTGVTANTGDGCVQIANAAITGAGTAPANVAYSWTWPAGTANGWGGWGALSLGFDVGYLDISAGPFGVPDDTETIDGGASISFAWTALGVPGGANVTSVALAFNRQRIASLHLDTPSFGFYLVDGSNNNILTSNLALGGYSWVTNATDGSPVPVGPSTNAAIGSSYQAAATTVTLRLDGEVSSHIAKTDCMLDIQFSNVTLIVNYTTSSGNLSGKYLVTAAGPVMAWTDLGVPANASVTAVKLIGLDRKVGSANDIANNILTLGISPAGNTTATVLAGTSNLASYTLPNTAGSFSTLSAGSNTAVSSLYSNSSSSVQMTLGLDVISGSSGGGVIIDEFKNLGLLIYYALGTTVGAVWSRVPIGTNGQIFTSNGTLGGWTTLSYVGPFTGTPANAQVLTWNAAGSTWYPANSSGGTTTPVDDGNSGTSITINWSTGSTHYLKMTGNCTLAFSNPTDGGRYTLLANSGAGGFVMTWPANVKWGLGGQPLNSQVTNVNDLFTMVYRSSANVYFMSYNLGY